MSNTLNAPAAPQSRAGIAGIGLYARVLAKLGDAFDCVEGHHDRKELEGLRVLLTEGTSDFNRAVANLFVPYIDVLLTRPISQET